MLKLHLLHAFPNIASTHLFPNITPHIPTTSSTTVQYPIEEELRGKSITGLSTPNSLDRTTSNYNEHQYTPNKLQYPNFLLSQLEHNSNSLLSTTLNPINTPPIPTTSPTTLTCPNEEELRGKSITGLSTLNSLDRTTRHYHEHQSTPTKFQYPNLFSSQLEHNSNSLHSTTLNPINIPPFQINYPTTLKCPNEVELRGKSIT